MQGKLNFAYFITPHGYGHAARAAAVMCALRREKPSAQFEIFTRVPEWFFAASLGGSFTYHDLYTDVGLAQDSVMDENLPETVRLLGSLAPFRAEQVDALAAQVRQAGCRMVLCDVAPLGIAVARAAGLPSVLVENFTWDWIYEGYVDREPRLAPYIDYLHDAFASAQVHIRTEPACSYELPAALTTLPVGRAHRRSAAETRAALGIDPAASLVLVTMGGIGSRYPFLDHLAPYPGAFFIIPGASDRFEKRGSLVLLPHHSNFYHPDLVNASDAVIGKLGYSTLAEAYLAGIPYACIPRPRFRESEVMVKFVQEKMNGVAINEGDFFAARWLDAVPQLLSIPRRPPSPGGAEQIARFLLA